jgi:ABC-type amino acid transport substrate-binding protein
MNQSYRSPRLLLILAAVLAAVAMACGGGGAGGGNSSAPKTSTVTAAAAPTFPAGSTMASLLSKGSMTIGVKYDVPLMGLYDPATQKLDGFDIAIGKEIAKDMGLKENQVKFIEAVTANRIPFLTEDKADLMISTFTITDERKQQIDFSRPYYVAGQSVMVKSDNNTIKGVKDLAGKNVCAQSGSTSEAAIKQMVPTANLLPLQVLSACVQAMKDGRVDAVSTDDIQLAGFAIADKSIKMVGGQFTVEPYGIGIKKGKSDMVQFVNDEITKMLQDGRWEKIYNQYLSQVPGAPSSADAKARVVSTP